MTASAADLRAKADALRAVIAADGPTLVAYSGGVDSAFLAWTTQQVLGDDMLAIIADSPSLARAQLRSALDFAAAHRIPCQIIQTHEGERAEYRRNDANRCFFCKDELFLRMEEERRRRPRFRVISYGINCDDQHDFRPGQRAASEHGIRTPLVDAGFGKAEIRALAREAGLAVWDLPASPCLASRIAYGIEVTPEVLAKIEAAESAVRAMGFRQFRVRCHGDVARVEIARDELPRALTLEAADRLTAALKRAGFRYATLDLEGFRSGALNEMLVGLQAQTRD